jgi:hypothetical protein
MRLLPSQTPCQKPSLRADSVPSGRGVVLSTLSPNAFHPSADSSAAAQGPASATATNSASTALQGATAARDVGDTFDTFILISSR